MRIRSVVFRQIGVMVVTLAIVGLAAWSLQLGASPAFAQETCAAGAKYCSSGAYAGSCQPTSRSCPTGSVPATVDGCATCACPTGANGRTRVVCGSPAACVENPLGDSCTTADGEHGTKTGNACNPTCTAKAKTSVVLAPSAAQVEVSDRPAVSVVQGGTGDLLNLQTQAGEDTAARKNILTVDKTGLMIGYHPDPERMGIDLSASGGQNLIYGIAKAAGLNAALDALLKFEVRTESGGTEERFRVDGGGNVTAAGSVRGAKLCIGSDCKGAWPAGFDGSGYVRLQRSGEDLPVNDGDIFTNGNIDLTNGNIFTRGTARVSAITFQNDSPPYSGKITGRFSTDGDVTVNGNTDGGTSGGQRARRVPLSVNFVENNAQARTRAYTDDDVLFRVIDDSPSRPADLAPRFTVTANGNVSADGKVSAKGSLYTQDSISVLGDDSYFRGKVRFGERTRIADGEGMNVGGQLYATGDISTRGVFTTAGPLISSPPVSIWNNGAAAILNHGEKDATRGMQLNGNDLTVSGALTVGQLRNVTSITKGNDASYPKVTLDAANVNAHPDVNGGFIVRDKASANYAILKSKDGKVYLSDTDASGATGVMLDGRDLTVNDNITANGTVTARQGIQSKFVDLAGGGQLRNVTSITKGGDTSHPKVTLDGTNVSVYSSESGGLVVRGGTTNADYALLRSRGTLVTLGNGNYSGANGIEISGKDLKVYDNLTTAGSIVASGSILTVDTLTARKGVKAGSRDVAIINADGKIPAISSTYIADLSGASITGVVKGFQEVRQGCSGVASCTATCPTGKRAIGGGCAVPYGALTASFPSSNGAGWICTGSQQTQITAVVNCATVQ